MIGRRISKYTVKEKIGEGGMGEVFLGEDTELGRTVAIKFLPAGIGGDPAALERFRREARAAAALNHPHIVTIHEIGEAEGRHFIVMEHVDGEPLRDVINRGDITVPRAVEIAAQITDGLAKAHGAGVVHRDIKPENILIDADGRVRILDFGLAKLHGVTQITQEASTLGTVNYMSPEQTRGEVVDARSDLFSLGVVLYEMIAGQRPFAGEHRAAVMYAIGAETPQPLARYNVNAGAGLEHVVDKLLQKRPDERYQTAGDLFADLKRELRQSDSHVSSIPPTAATSPARRSRTPAALAVTAVLIAAAVIAAWMVMRGGDGSTGGVEFTGPGGAHKTKPSVAVLPLENLSPDPAQAYFADGMTEALTASLARIGGLKVISRTSAMQYKDSDKPLPQIARELGVTRIVEGSVLHADGRVRITTQLIDATTDEHLWAQDYEREVSDVIALQSEVARAVANAVHVTLTPAENVLLSQHTPVDPAAFRLYLLGRQEWNYRAEPRVRKAMAYFRQAVELDPEYAVAFAGLADAHLILADWGYVSPTTGYPKAREFAQRALAIDPMLAEAQANQAWISYVFEWNFERSEREFKRAIELKPNYATTHQWYGEMLAALGRGDDAIAELNTALELDPLSPIIRSLRAWHLGAYGRKEEGYRALQELLADHPDFAPAYFHLLFLGFMDGDMAPYVTGWINGARLIGWFEPEQLESVEEAFQRGGIEGWAQRTAKAFEQRCAAERYHPAVNAMLAHYFAGNTDDVFTWLDRALDARGTWTPMVLGHPMFAPLREDPRFAERAARIRNGMR